MAIAIVCDSSACIEPPVDGDCHLSVLPITIHLPAEDLTDGTPAAARRVYRALERGDAVKSSSPSVVAYLEAIEDGSGDGVVVITPASEFTVMHRNASLAADIATVPVAVVDSRTAAAAHGLVVSAAHAAAMTGARLSEVKRVAEDASRRAELVATIDNLDAVQRSGRVPSGTIESARGLGIHPVFRLRDGVVERLGIARERETAYDRIRNEFVSSGGARAEETAVFHAMRPRAAQSLRAALDQAAFVTEFSPAMGIHTGPGVVGVAWLRKRTRS